MRKASRTPHARFLRTLMAWAVVLVQLHLFFVLELHHHDAPPSDGPAACAPAVRPSSQSKPPAAGTYCAACRIVRQGSVFPASAFILPEIRATSRAKDVRPPTFNPISALIVCGRAPPSSC